VEFDAKGDRKDAEMTIFKLKDGKVVPIAIVKNGQASPFTGAAAPAAAPATEQGKQGEAKPAETKK
jgi:branched-chain amino acid transport system substrate-binding protein